MKDTHAFHVRDTRGGEANGANSFYSIRRCSFLLCHYSVNNYCSSIFCILCSIIVRLMSNYRLSCILVTPMICCLQSFCLSPTPLVFALPFLSVCHGTPSQVRSASKCSLSQRFAETGTGTVCISLTSVSQFSHKCPSTYHGRSSRVHYHFKKNNLKLITKQFIKFSRENLVKELTVITINAAAWGWLRQ